MLTPWFNAMRAKDTNRLSVLRSILTEVTNLSKTKSPINKDIQLLALLRKRTAAAKTAADEFKTHQRPDLADKEELQGKILEEYLGQVEVVSEAEIRKAVEDVVERLRSGGEKVDIGAVLENLLGERGELGAKPVDRGDVARVVKEIVHKRE
ncbi:hypothetical protein FGG08_001540 [Glutinoglossum americanum]|uniref:Altered inheritance of mitochondria protein 41 n=1 Tax=Glutinoglossum americanum TaxID=1670608 RepID=A0A9P8I812_9PEZI|nr:hypothetical protein FGG08_001540 [Glutinoglossum americanum]